MKHLLLIITLFATLSCCKKDDSNDQLPPATQTGAGTFACYVNGSSYIDTSGGYFNCFYQYVDGEYFFHITAHDIVNNIDEITIYSNKIQMIEGETYQLMNYEEYSVSGIVFFENTNLSVSTTSNMPGVLTITKLDFNNFIASGTFEFDVVHPNTDETIQIRDGRFDTLFTQ